MHLLKKLVNHEVIEWDLKLGRNIRDFKLDPGTDFIVHLAALVNPRESNLRPEQYWENNVVYSKKIFNLSENIPLVYASSACVKEWFRSCYGVTKKAMEELAMPGHIGLRFETVYGLGDSTESLINKLRNKRLEYATNHVRDFIHVDDIVNSILLFLKIGTSKREPTYEIGTGEGVLVSKLVRDFGANVPTRDGGDEEIKKSIANIQGIKALNWRPRKTVQEFLKEEME